jgi:hypothetical protein
VPKVLTRDQLQSRKDKAARFVRDVLGDPDRAEEIEEESLEDYAERRKITLTNPSGRVAVIMTKEELLDRVQDLEEENQQLQDRLDAVADLVNGDEGDDDDDDDDDEEDEEEEKKETDDDNDDDDDDDEDEDEDEEEEEDDRD